MIKAWYFSDESRTLRYGDGRKIKLGIEHTVKGYPEPCSHGLHGCERLIDALGYASGPIVWRIELLGRVKRDDDKIAATRRKYVGGGVDISDVLREFARKQALSVAHLWDMPEVVRRYLETGDESIRAAASAAAWAAASAAARAAASAAARAAARAAAWAAASDAAWDAAWAAADALAAARAAAWDAAWDAASAAARAAAWAAAWAAALAAANTMLTDIVEKAIKEAK